MPPRADDKPLLVIPAAGSGSRLKMDLPKFAVPVNGRPMLAWLLDLYAPLISGAALVVAPSGVSHARRLTAGSPVPVSIDVQERPTGMLDAVMMASARVRQSAASRVWITWCDQIAIEPATVETLAALSLVPDAAPLVMPTCVRPHPYIHLERDEDGRIRRVLHRREGDVMPEQGEGDAGLFSLSRRAYLDELPAYAAAVAIGTSTGERNLLPFIPWLAAHDTVVTFPCIDENETIGVNTPEELHLLEAHLATRTCA